MKKTLRNLNWTIFNLMGMMVVWLGAMTPDPRVFFSAMTLLLTVFGYGMYRWTWSCKTRDEKIK